MPETLGFRLTWYGHSCVHIATDGGSDILIDPWFGNPMSTADADSIERCDLMLVTHGHHDHLGAMPGEIASADALTIARRTKPAWPAIHELSLWLAAQATGADIVGMNKGGSVDIGDLRVSMVGADHSGGDFLTSSGVPLFLGDPVGFVIELENGRRVYNAGDTALFGDMRLIGEMYRPDVAFLPIGGHFTMDPGAAARAVELLAVQTVIPIHYGTFPVLAGTPDGLRTELGRLGLDSVRVVTPEPGVPIS